VHLVSLDHLLSEEIGVLLLGRGRQVVGCPEVRGEEGGGLGQGVVDGHRQVTSRAGVTRGGRVDVLHASHREQLLGDEGGHDAGTTRRRDESATHGAALARHLAGHRMRSTRVQTPVATAHRDQVHLGVDDAAANGSGNFLGSLDAQTNVASTITDSDVALEASALTGSGLLLDRHDLHHLILQSRAQQVIDDLVLLDGKREKEDLLNGLDLALLDQTAKLGDWDPLILLTLVASSTTTTSSATSATALTISASSSASSSKTSSS